MSRGPAEKKRRRATYADIEALPPHVVGEIIAGELVVTPRPAPAHGHTASVLGSILVGAFGRRGGRGGGEPGGWWIEDEPELHLGIDPEFEAIVPDIAGWRRERMPTLPTTAWFSVVPDWVCEVLSPSTAALDRAEKMPFYARAGVKHAWLVDPVLLTLEVDALDREAWRLLKTHRGDTSVRAQPFDAVEIDLSWLWER